MPPKKKKGPKKPVIDPAIAEAEAAEREGQLRSELDKRILSLMTLQKRLVNVRGDNDGLRRELEQTKNDSEECKRYLLKRLVAHKDTLSAIQEAGEKRLETARLRKSGLLDYYEEKVRELINEQHAKHDVLERIKAEINDLKGVQELRKTQLSKIADLEQRVGDIRKNHIEHLHNLRLQYAEEKENCKREAQKKVAFIKNMLLREADFYLNRHVENIVTENVKLRDELQFYIKLNLSLEKQKTTLDNQLSYLMRQKEYFDSQRMFWKAMMDEKRIREQQIKAITAGEDNTVANTATNVKTNAIE